MPMPPRTVIHRIAELLVARHNCQTSGNKEWFTTHELRLEMLVNEFLPSGGGFDAGTKLDFDSSNAGSAPGKAKIVFNTSFHHMHESGMYDGWTEHRVTVEPTFTGITLTISGRNRNDIKDYIAESFHHALSTLVQESESGFAQVQAGDAHPH